MNKKGLTMIELIGVIIIIGVIATIAVPNVSKYIERGQLTTFISYEKSMEDAATNGVLDCIGNNAAKCDPPEKGEIKDVKLKTLIDGGFIENLKTPEGGTCDIEKSFVRIENKGNLNYKFKVCLYCDGYTTDEDYCK